jgi:MarR family transcriptional regulator, transcriptional regulator for hemolysin
VRPSGGPPIGLQLANTARTVSRAFNGVLAREGASLPTWLILTALRGDQWRTQLELARSLGIEGPTLTRHLDGLERAGLVERRRDPNDRRAVQVEITDAGVELHNRLRGDVIAFDRRLRDGLTEDELDGLRDILGKFEHNVRQEDKTD